MHGRRMWFFWMTLLLLTRLQIVRWDIISSLDIVSEVVLFAMSIFLVKDLKMDFSRKAFVVGAFGLRLPCVVPPKTSFSPY